MAPITPSSPEKPPLVWPPRPPCRRASPRGATLCFWTVFLLFIAALGYLALLAFTAEGGSLQLDSGIDSHLLAGMLLAGVAIAAVAASIATHHRHHHHH
jgi:hypothetical protein